MATTVQPSDKTVSVDGTQVHYLDWGTAGKPPMVLLHGLRGHAHSWDTFSAAMCEDYHVLALDQRGRGDSGWAKDGLYTTDLYVSDLLGFSEALRLDPFILVGHSMGGRNGIAFSGRYPQKVQRLILVDIGPTGDPRGGERIRREILDAPEQFASFGQAMDYTNKGNRYAPQDILRRRVQYQTKVQPDGTLVWRYDPAIREQWRKGTNTSVDLWPAFRQISCPILIVRGVESDILGPEHAQQMLDANPRAQLVEIQRAAHMVFEENPDDFLSAMRAYLQAR